MEIPFGFYLYDRGKLFVSVYVGLRPNRVREMDIFTILDSKSGNSLSE